jgi:hypothetical protein
MAYTDLQRRDIAREIARSGGNASAAMKRLRVEYETFETISESTIARVMKSPGFAQIIAEEGEKLRIAMEAGRAEAERDRARRDAEGIVINRIARNDIILDELRTRLEQKLKTSDPKDISEAVRVFATLSQITDRQKDKTVVAVASFPAAQALVQSVAEVAELMLGARKKEFTDAVKERYAAKLKAMESAELAEAAT